MLQNSKYSQWVYIKKNKTKHKTKTKKTQGRESCFFLMDMNQLDQMLDLKGDKSTVKMI